MQTNYKSFPLVSLIATKPDPIGFFEAMALSGFGSTPVRIPASIQRRHFGAVPFGKRAVSIEGSTVHVFRSCDFGRDYDKQSVYFDQCSKVWRSSHDDTSLGLTVPR